MQLQEVEDGQFGEINQEESQVPALLKDVQVDMES